VSIVVLNYNGMEHTAKCLESIRSINYPNYSVTVVDNGSSEAMDAARLPMGTNIVRLQTNERFAGGNNAGMVSSQNCDYVLLLNNDVVVLPDFLSKLVSAAEGDNAIGIVGPRICHMQPPHETQHFVGGYNLWTGGLKTAPKTKNGNVEILRNGCVFGCCMLIKHAVIEKIGLLDTDYTLYWEENDYCIRAERSGFKIAYVPDSVIWHLGAVTANKVVGQDRYHFTRGRFLFEKKHASSAQYLSFILYFFGFYFWLSLAYYTLKYRNPKLLLSFLKGVKDGLLWRKS
jgi:GT2 family glycosyltransferase